MRQVYFLALAGALVLNATANLMMKFGMERHKAMSMSIPPGFWALVAALASNWVLIVGLCCFAVNVVLYTFSLKGLPISVAYPIMVTVGFAIIVIVAGVYLHERLSPIQWVGVVLILVGVWLVGSGVGGRADPHRPTPVLTARGAQAGTSGLQRGESAV